MANSDGQRRLYELAKAAGISREWHDHRGELHQVEPDVLRILLSALELPADTSAQCEESLEQLRMGEEQEVPSLTTGRCGESLALPTGLRSRLTPGETVHLQPESAAPLTLRIEAGPEGELLLPPLESPGYYTLEAGDLRAQLAIAPPSCYQPQDLTGLSRSYGLAAQIYSLRRTGDGGIGDYTALRELAFRCGESGADALAISPVHALFSADETRYSPYAPSSRLFLNVWYVDAAAVLGTERVYACIDDEALRHQLHLLEEAPLIEWPEAIRAKLAVLRCVWDKLGSQLMAGEDRLGRDYRAFCESGGQALQQHALFETLHAQHYRADSQRWHWRSWPAEYRHPDSRAVRQAADEHSWEIGFHCFLQWLAARGLAGAQQAAREGGMGIGLVADLAIGTDSGGSHAWSRQAEMLNGISVGAPPDLINHQGQNWGLTSFSPRALKAHNYQPFVEMLRSALRYAGGLRIDHVLGLRRLWLIPEGAPATHGAYLSFPQRDMLNLIALESWRHRAVVVGEDLGTVPKGFRDEISDVGLLGMQVLWFEQEHGLYLDPSRWRGNAMATTTTHDLPTVAGWWRGRDIDWNDQLDRLAEGRTAEDEKRDRARDRHTLWAAFEHAGTAQGEEPSADDPQAAVDSALSFVTETPSPLAIIPVEDVLGLDEQPNLPGTTDEHPNWRRRLTVPVDELMEAESVRHRLMILQSRLENDDNP